MNDKRLAPGDIVKLLVKTKLAPDTTIDDALECLEPGELVIVMSVCVRNFKCGMDAIVLTERGTVGRVFLADKEIRNKL